MTEDQGCIQCGRCCERWGWNLQGIPEDLHPWITQNRQDILQHVSIRLKNRKRIKGSEISVDDFAFIARIRYWIKPNGRPPRYCPFFERREDGLAYCKIHDVKPKICRDFTPWDQKTIEFDFVKCPGCREKTP
ncbi:MAG TPA: YkgJ family cysteine cluster protein [Methanoregulaceae archaeon]|nr:YkgJ family cysteine cluster protein [Methanoregulaceae archaeon]